MKPYTLDNNLVYGYNNGIFNPNDKIKIDALQCSYARAQRIPRTFQEECHAVAKLLSVESQRLNRTPMVFLSGGYDSEVVAKSFIETNLDFQLVTFRFKNGLNRHEMYYVDKFSKRHNLNVMYVDIDIQEWLVNPEALEMFNISHCHFPEMLPHMKLMDIVWNNWNGLPILGNGDLYVSREINPIWRLYDNNAEKYVWNYLEYEYILAWFRFAIAKQILGGIGFFQHTPEITLSMILEPEIQNVCNNNNQYRMSSRSTKYLIYKKYWPDLEDRIKYDGGELSRGLHYKFMFTHTMSRMIPYLDIWKESFTQFQNRLMPL